MTNESTRQETNGAARPLGTGVSAGTPAHGVSAGLGEWPQKSPRRPSVVQLRRQDVLWLLDETRREIGRAREKFPSNEKLLAALGEELGEVARALLNGEGRERVREECVQVAAVALRLASEGDGDFGGYGEGRRAPGKACEPDDLFEGAAKAKVERPIVDGLGQAIEANRGPEMVLSVEGTIGGAPAKAPEPTVLDLLWELWPVMVRRRGKGPDVDRVGTRSSSEIAGAVERLLTKPAHETSAAALSTKLREMAGGASERLNGTVVRKALSSAMNLERRIAGTGKRYRLAVSTEQARVMWRWKEVAG